MADSLSAKRASPPDADVARTDRDDGHRPPRIIAVPTAAAGETGGNGLSIVETALDQLECAMFGLLDHNAGRCGVSLRLVRQARQQYALRRRCDALLDGLSGEPAWDMLLELFIAGAEGRKTPVKNLCLAASASMSTAMRRLDGLAASGLVRKTGDALDARRSLVELTEQGWATMVALLQSPS